MADSFFAGKNSDSRVRKGANGFILTGVEKISGGVSTSDYMASASTAEKWLNFYFRTTAASGSAQGLYMRLNVNGAGTASTVIMRPYLTITSAQTTGGHAAIHATAEIGADGSSTGLMAAGRFQVASTAATRTMTGTKAAIYLEGNWGVGTTMGGEESFIAVTDLTAVATPYFLDLKTLTSSATGAFEATTDANNGTPSGYLRCRITGGAVGYIAVYSTHA
jgi:hypothetical protein